MRPLPKAEREEMPVALDATDLDAIAKVAGRGARMRIVSPRYVYDSADDLVKNTTWSTRLVELSIEFGKNDKLSIVPFLYATGELSKKLGGNVIDILDDKRREIWPWRLAATLIAISFTVGLAMAFAVAEERGRSEVTGEFDWNGVDWSQLWMLILGIPLVWGAVTLPPSIFHHRISPVRREDSFVRKHVRTVPGLVVGAAVALIAPMLFKALFSLFS